MAIERLNWLSEENANTKETAKALERICQKTVKGFINTKSTERINEKMNKRLAEICRDTIKEFKNIEIWSLKQNQRIGYVNNKDEIIPYWSSVSFTMKDPVSNETATRNGLIQKITFGTTTNSKKDTIFVVDKVFI